jgi:hypothetical protein
MMMKSHLANAVVIKTTPPYAPHLHIQHPDGKCGPEI